MSISTYFRPNIHQNVLEILGVNIHIICTLLKIDVVEDLKIHQIDVNTTFLNGDLEEGTYMDQFEGIVSKGEESLVHNFFKTL